jgi:hypothetical protein
MCKTCNSSRASIQRARLAALFILFLVPFSFAACPNLITADYTMAGNEAATGTCFTLGAPNIVLDCNGFRITLANSADVPIIDVNATNTTIKNCGIYETGITARARGTIRLNATANETKILNTNVSSINHYGITIDSSGNNLTDFKVNTSTATYAALFTASSNNVIYNSLFNKTATANSYALYWNGGANNTLDGDTIDSNIMGVSKYGAYFVGFSQGAIRNSIICVNSTALYSIYLTTSSSDNSLDNITLLAAVASTTPGIYIDQSPNNNLTNSIINVRSTGVYIGTSSGNTFIENTSVTTTVAGTGIQIEATSGASDSNRFNNLTMYVVGYGLYFSPSHYNIITNSIINSSASVAFYTDDTSISNIFENNTFASRPGAATAMTIQFTGAATNNILRANDIASPSALGLSHAIYFAATGSNNNQIIGNNITTTAGSTSYGIYFVGASTGNLISNNSILSRGTGYAIQITGNGASNTGNNVTDNTINASGLTSPGILLSLSTKNRILRNNITAGTIGIYLSSSGAANKGNNISANIVNITPGAASTYYALRLDTSTYNYIEDNILESRRDTAVYVYSASNNNVFSRNEIITNQTGAYYGINMVTNNQNNVFQDNNITSLRGAGISLSAGSATNRFSGGRIDAYTGTAVSLTSSENNFTDMNITSGIGAAGGYGIYISGALDMRLYNLNITSNGSAAFYATLGSYNTIVENATIRAVNGQGIYLVNDVQSNSFRNLDAQVNNTYALYMDGSTAAVIYNNFTNANLVSNYSAGGAASRFATNANNNIFRNASFRNTGAAASSHGLQLYLSSNNQFIDSSFNVPNTVTSYAVQAYGTGLSGSTNNLFANSTLYSPSTFDVYMSGGGRGSQVLLLNCTFNYDEINTSAAYTDIGSYINVSWYLRANVTTLSGTPLELANVVIRDVSGTLISNQSTDSTGASPWVAAQEFRRNSTSAYYNKPYNATASVGAVSNYTSIWATSIGSTLTQQILLNATACGALDSNYTLTNNVYATSNCFTANGVSGITLDCAGYTINYSRGAAGCGIASSSANLTAVNCRFLQGNFSSSASGAVCPSSSSNISVANSTISARGGGNGSDFIITDSAAIALNVTMNSSNNQFIAVSGSPSLTRSWYVRGNLTDSYGTPLPVSTAIIRNTFNTTAMNSTLTNGVLPPQALPQYYQTGPLAYTYYSNYTLLGFVDNSSNSTSFNLTGNQNIMLPIPATLCGNVGSGIRLNNSVYSDGTCFTPTASDITIDCAGYTVNYSRAGNGYYGVNATSFDHITVKDCNFILGNSSATASYALQLSNSDFFSLANSSITGKAANISSLNAEFINTRFDNTTLNFPFPSGNISIKWYAYLHAVGLAMEDVNGSPVNVTNATGALVTNVTTDINGTYTFLLTEYVRTSSTILRNDPYNFTLAHPETLVQNSTVVALNQSKNITVGLISAAIDVFSPNESQIYIQGDPLVGGPVEIRVNETKGQSWINNVTVTVYDGIANLTYQATELSPNIWGYDYDFDPLQPSASIPIVARGYNGAAFVSATRTFVFTRSSGSGISSPAMPYACPLNTYALQNQTINISATADLDTVLFAFTLNITHPNGSTSAPSYINATSTGAPSYIFNRTWSLQANQTGTYLLFFEARDALGNRTNATRYIYSMPANITTTLTANGPSMLYLKDVCSGGIVASGANLTGISLPPGNYTFEADDGVRNVLSLTQFNISAFSGNVLNYTEILSPPLPPASRRTIFEFSANVTGSAAYSIAEITINYTEYAGSLVAENSLEMNNCTSLSSCLWQLMNYTLNTSSNFINTTVPRLAGIYGVFEPAYPTPLPAPIIITAPIITMFAPAYKNMLNATNTTIYLRMSLDASLADNISIVSVNATSPTGLAFVLQNDSYSGFNSSFNYTYPFTPNETGVWILNARMNDTYNLNATANYSIIVSAANITLAISSFTADSSALVDPAQNATVLSGAANLSGSVAPGNYTYSANASNARISLFSLQVNGDITALNFTDLATTAVTAPTDRNALYVFSATSQDANYSSALLTINYSNISGVIAEQALEVWYCATASNCTNMTELSSTISEASDIVSLQFASLSGVYGLFQPVQTLTNTVTVTETTTTTRKVNVEVPVDRIVIEIEEVITPVEVPVTKYSPVRLIEGPRFIDVHPGDAIEEDITLHNDLGQDLSGITLYAESDPEVQVSFSKSSFDIGNGETDSTKITVTSSATSGSFTATLYAEIPALGLKDKLSIPVRVGSNLLSDKQKAQERITFAKKLIEDNPECLDLTESLLSATIFLDSGGYTDAESKAQRAISGCSNIMALRGVPEIKTKVLKEPDWFVTFVVPVVLFGLLAAAGLFIFMFIRWRERRKSHRESEARWHHQHHGGGRAP